MSKPAYGDPVVTLRLPRGMITAARIAARRHDMTFSGLVRRLIDDQLQQDGIPWQNTAEPTPGQKSIDDYILDDVTKA